MCKAELQDIKSIAAQASALLEEDTRRAETANQGTFVEAQSALSDAMVRAKDELGNSRETHKDKEEAMRFIYFLNSCLAACASHKDFLAL